MLGDYSPFETFETIFRAGNVRKESYFDLMTHFFIRSLEPLLLGFLHHELAAGEFLENALADAEHFQLLDLLAKRNEAGAVALMQKHMERSRHVWSEGREGRG